jgi:ABC-type amino acid transport substrate-binding protein
MVDQGVSRDTAREAAVTRRRWLAAALAMAAAPVLAQPASADALPKLRERGSLVVAVYRDLPPFNMGGQGIDVALAQALAEALDLKLSLLPFIAGEDMGDDLRNMVWRGHYLGHGPADVLVHVPVDRPLMDSSPRVQIFAPYYRERLVIARDLNKVPRMDSLDDFAGQKIAVAGQSLPGWLLIGAEGGRYREQLLTQWSDGHAAAQGLKRGEVAAAAGLASELESALAGDPRFAIEPLPLPRMRDGWAIGLAVRKESTDLAQALQAAMNRLADSGRLKQIFAASNVTWRKP